MHQRFDLAFVNVGNLFQRSLGQRGQIGGGDVVRNLRWAFGAGNSAGDGREFQNPTQGELGERRAGRNKFLQSLHGAQARLEIYAGESFAPVKRFAVTVEIPVIIFCELAEVRHFPRQQT